MERTIEQLTVHYRNAERCYGTVERQWTPDIGGVIDMACSACGAYWRFIVETEHATRFDGSQRLTLRRSTDPTAVPSGP